MHEIHVLLMATTHSRITTHTCRHTIAECMMRKEFFVGFYTSCLLLPLPKLVVCLIACVHIWGQLVWNQCVARRILLTHRPVFGREPRSETTISFASNYSTLQFSFTKVSNVNFKKLNFFPSPPSISPLDINVTNHLATG